MNLIFGSIVLVGAIVLHPDGIAIKAPAQLGDLLRPFLGNAAPIVMGVAIFGAGGGLFLSGGNYDGSPGRHGTKNRLTSMQTGRLRSSLDLTVNLCENFHEFMP